MDYKISMEIKNNIMDKEKVSKWFLIGIGIFIVLSFLYGRFVNAPKFEERGVYTIGVFESFRTKKGSLYSIKYSFPLKYKNKYGESTYTGEKFDHSYIKRRFLVKYVEGEEYLSSLLLEYPVPDSIKSAPPEGWKELPTWAKQKR